MTIRRSKEEHPPSPSVSSWSSSSPRHWTGTSELDELHGRAKTRRPLPERIVGDGCALPEFDYAATAESTSPWPGKQALYEVTVHRKRAALKVEKRLAEVVAERRAFVRECHLLARIKHAHIVPLCGVSTTLSGLPCVLLRWCDNTVIRSLRLDEVGHDPEVRATVKREWPSRERLRLMGRARRRPGPFAHARDFGAHVAHRDVKPPTLEPDRDPLLVLYDFGSPWRCSPSTRRGRHLRADGRYRYQRYMSPEVARASRMVLRRRLRLGHLRARDFSFTGQALPWVVRVSTYRKGSAERQRPVIPSAWDHRLIQLFPQAWATADRRCDAASRDVCRDVVAHPGPRTRC